MSIAYITSSLHFQYINFPNVYIWDELPRFHKWLVSHNRIWNVSVLLIRQDTNQIHMNITQVMHVNYHYNITDVEQYLITIFWYLIV